MDTNDESSRRVDSWSGKVANWLSSNPARVALTCVQVTVWVSWIGWSIYIMWRVVSGTYLETPPASPTHIKLDLLQALAFLVAWSLLLLTITIRVVNKARDLQADTDKARWEIDQLIEFSEGRETENKELLEKAAERIVLVEEKTEQVILKLRQENEQLRQELSSES